MNKNWNNLLIQFTLRVIVVTFFSVQIASAQTIPTKPNIIVIMADDLDVGSLNTMLQIGAMPNFKSTFVDQGIKFKNFFVTNALCCPSRATYLSGQYTHNHQTLTNATVNGAVINFDDTTALPTWLSAPTTGYHTAHIGKYLNAYGILSEFNNPNPAIAQRVQDLKQQAALNTQALQPTYIPQGWNEWYGLIDLSTYCVYNYSINNNGHIMQYLKTGQILRDGVEITPAINDGHLHNYQTDVLAAYAKAVIQNNKSSGQPLFLSIMPLAPHVEKCGNHDPDGPAFSTDQFKDQFQWSIRPAERHLNNQTLMSGLKNIAATYLPLKKSFNTLDAGKPAELQQKLLPLDKNDQNGVFNQYANRLASLIAIDDLIGQVVAALGSQLNNTVIIFTADNGWFYGEHELSGKQLAYEEAIRVPLYMRVPGSTTAREITRVTLNNDLAPTIAALAGATPTRTVDGRSLLPLIQNSSITPWRKQFLVEHYLGIWPEDPQRFLDFNNLFALRTGAESSLPNRLYTEYYDGIQTKNGYYLHKGDTQISGDYVWNGTLLDTEYYNVLLDPLQINNLLFNINANPNKQKIMNESAKLKGWLDQLHLCKGIGCWLLENQ